MTTEPRVLEALRTVIDPEMGIDVVELGLVYGIDVHPAGTVDIRLGVTSPACPLGDYLCETAEDAVRAAVPEVRGVTVDLVLDPPWTPARMTAEARRRLGWPDQG
ncbi:MAG TPA: metal-sulfur cluster assembly factor [Azospirillum sp.]|nr:metal-sulfur cluster assembly factor [Azospirillum sp.]